MHRLLLIPLLAATFLLTTDVHANDQAALDEVMKAGVGINRLNALIIAQDGKILAERAFRGPRLTTPVNVKSVSKSLLSAIAGVALDKGLLPGPEMKIAPVFADWLPKDAELKKQLITLDHLLSMRSGLERTSGRNYGRWVASKNWSRFVLNRPLADEPGGIMHYSTGNFHLVSALLTRITKRDTHSLAQDWLAKPLGIKLPPWQKSPEGIYLGGNNMLISPRDMLTFGEMYRNGGMHTGKRVLSEAWIKQSWTGRGQSRFSGDYYGLGWFITEIWGERAYYARGFGGQFIYILPAMKLTIVMTSNPAIHARIGGYRYKLLALTELIISSLR